MGEILESCDLFLVRVFHAGRGDAMNLKEEAYVLFFFPTLVKSISVPKIVPVV